MHSLKKSRSSPWKIKGFLLVCFSYNKENVEARSVNRSKVWDWNWGRINPVTNWTLWSRWNISLHNPWTEVSWHLYPYLLTSPKKIKAGLIYFSLRPSMPWLLTMPGLPNISSFLNSPQIWSQTFFRSFDSFEPLCEKLPSRNLKFIFYLNPVVQQSLKNVTSRAAGST